MVKFEGSRFAADGLTLCLRRNEDEKTVSLILAAVMLLLSTALRLPPVKFRFRSKA